MISFFFIHIETELLLTQRAVRSKTVHSIFIKFNFIHFMKGLNFEEYVIVVFVMSPFYEKHQYTILEPDAVPAIGTT